MLVVVYVDDILVASKQQKSITELRQYLSRMFEIKDLGKIKYCLGIEFSQDDDGYTMRQKGYIKDVLDRYGMYECKTVSTPLDLSTKLKRNEEKSDDEGKNLPYRELIGAMMYLAMCTRPDIAHTVSYLGQYNSCYDKTHWTAAKRVLRYLKGTMDVGLKFRRTTEPLTGYVDADWANCLDDRRSYTGYAFILSGTTISWESRKQRTVALSSTEAEYMALTEAAKEAIYLQRFLKELGFDELTKVKVYCDNNGARKLAENPIFHHRTKHIDVRHHFIREVLEDGLLEVTYCATEDMAADILTKGLSGPKTKRCLEILGVEDVDKTSLHIEGKC